MAEDLGEHSRPNKTGWIDRVPTDEEIMRFNESIMPELQPALPPEGLGLNPLEQYLADAIAERYRSPDILDIGCGNAKFLVALLAGKIAGSGTGLDASISMVKNARQTAQNAGVKAEFFWGTLESLFPTTEFDVVVANELLEHLFDASAGVAKIASLLRRDGMLCGSVPFGKTCDCDAHLRYFDCESLRELFGQFFLHSETTVVELTDDGERHIRFVAMQPRSGGD